MGSNRDTIKITLSQIFSETKRFLYIESSFPRVKGDKARLESRLTVSTRNCFTFWYHMHGETTGRLNVYLRSHGNDAETLIWRLAGSHGNVWKKVEIPMRQIYAYQVKYIYASCHLFSWEVLLFLRVSGFNILIRRFLVL